MSDMETVYLTSDYNPKYINKPIQSIISGAINTEIPSNQYDLSIEDTAENLPHGVAKVVLKMDVETDKDKQQLVREINSEVSNNITDEAVYNLNAN